MKVSLNWIRELSGVTAKTPELLEIIGSRLGAIDKVTDVGGRYEGIFIAKVVSCENHPSADKLYVCLIDDKGVVKGVKRNSKGLVQVVCGAPNVKAGMLVAWVAPGGVVPATADKEPLVIEVKEVRGVASSGMLASAKELGLGDNHAGILELDDSAKIGASFAKTYELDDQIIDIENKMFTHRPDCFGILGVAREVAGISHQKFSSPGWYRQDAKVASGRLGLRLEIKNDAPKFVPRFSAVVIGGVKVGPSPVWLQATLGKLDIKPVNNVVDITNYMMILSAQPLHAYDYDKVATGILGVRPSRTGEELKLLGGKSIKLKTGAVVITDGRKPIGLAGIMGGADTEVSAGTQNIILECATFDPNQTRKMAYEYGLFTEAATRFTKRMSPHQNMPVLARAAELIHQLAGGVPGSSQDAKNSLPKPVRISVAPDFINSRLGLDIAEVEMKRLLTNVEFQVDTALGKLNVAAPFWRTDIVIAEDIVEEIGRLYGYEHLIAELPTKNIAPVEKDPLLELKANLRDILAKAGGNELLTYSFVHGSLMQNACQNLQKAYHLRNAISPDLQYYRQSLTPSLMAKVHPAIKTGFGEFAIFELGKGHIRGLLDSEKLPKELEKLALVIASKKPKFGAAYFSAKKLCDYLLHELGINEARYTTIDLDNSTQTPAYYEPSRAAELKVGGRTIGQLGEYRASVRLALKLPQYCAGFDLDLEELMDLVALDRYQPLNRYPAIEQDLCLRSPTHLTYETLTNFVRRELDQASRQHGYKYVIDPLDIFQRDAETSHKQTTWRINLSHFGRTLTTTEANHLFDNLAAAAKKQLGAERV